ncbi:MAG: TlpA family protein disulfide reductase [Acidobacteria bacterium]|jgi:peroxiredoxin|nr:MAG: TlpA family protein disulfide reductase [Acidobacteriota bacterium]GIU82381.1 MAG: hypothetical protein KatS3mg006_1445 [Pyrinomonadaceae bacterium]
MRFGLVLFIVLLSFSLLYAQPEANGKSELQPAYDFFVDSLDGKTYSLEDFEGKNLLIIFWATSCIICKDEFSKLSQQLKARAINLEVLAITAENETIVAKYLRKNPLDFMVGVNGLRIILRYAKRDSEGRFMLGYPSYVLINSRSEIVKRIQGEGKIDEILQTAEQLMKEQNSAKQTETDQKRGSDGTGSTTAKQTEIDQKP